MDVKKNIRKLRLIAFFLFFTPALGLLGSLVIHNYLVSFHYDRGINYNFETKKIGEKFLIKCSEKNNFCKDKWTFKKHKKLDECNVHTVKRKWVLSSEEEIEIKKKDIKKSDKDVFAKFQITDQLNQYCILNSKMVSIYTKIPFFFEKIYEIKYNPNIQLGTSEIVNPLIYGETSISNIVKRNPIKFIFKPLLFISVVLMFFYWTYNKIIISKLSEKKINNYFYIFGILSAIFLFLHVFFLGWIFENNFLTKLRRSYIVFFILFEFLAQAFLIRDIFLRKEELKEYLYSLIIYFKLFFVICIFIFSFTILSILIFYDLSSTLDYILEWNYFLILLFFYLLSSLMWKKN